MKCFLRRAVCLGILAIAVCSMSVCYAQENAFQFLNETAQTTEKLGSTAKFSVPTPPYSYSIEEQAAVPVPDKEKVPERLPSASKQELYSRILLHYSNIAYLMHRDAYRSARRLRDAAMLFLSSPDAIRYARLKLTFAQSYGAFLRTSFTYYDNSEALDVRERLLPPDQLSYNLADPYDIFKHSEDTKKAIKKAIKKKASVSDNSEHDLEKEIDKKITGGFGALRRIFTLEADDAVLQFTEMTDRGSKRRTFLDTVTAGILDDTKRLLKEYRPTEDATSERLLSLPREQAVYRLFAYMDNEVSLSADNKRDYTHEACRYGDAANMISGLRALVSGTYGTTTGPGLAVVALTSGQRHADFLKFTVKEAEETAVVLMRQQRDRSLIDRSRDRRKALAEALRFLEF